MAKTDMIPNGENVTSRMLSYGLQALVDTQRNVSGLVDGATNLPVTKEQVSTVAFSLIQEVGELANEIGWKPWKEVTRDNERIADEFADILAFLGLLMYYLVEDLGITTDDLVYAYAQKSRRNVRRFIGKTSEAGYGFGITHEKLRRAGKLLEALSPSEDEEQLPLPGL